MRPKKKTVHLVKLSISQTIALLSIISTSIVFCAYNVCIVSSLYTHLLFFCILLIVCTLEILLARAQFEFAQQVTLVARPYSFLDLDFQATLCVDLLCVFFYFFYCHLSLLNSRYCPVLSAVAPKYPIFQ